MTEGKVADCSVRTRLVEGKWFFFFFWRGKDVELNNTFKKNDRRETNSKKRKKKNCFLPATQPMGWEDIDLNIYEMESTGIIMMLTVSARMKPFSKSEWITPAAWGAVIPDQERTEVDNVDQHSSSNILKIQSKDVSADITDWSSTPEQPKRTCKYCPCFWFLQHSKQQFQLMKSVYSMMTPK